MYALFDITEESPIPEEPVDEDSLVKLILAALLLFLLLGIRYGRSGAGEELPDGAIDSLTEADLTDDERSILDIQSGLFMDSVKKIIERAGNISILATIDKLIAQSSSMFWAGFALNAKSDSRYRWDMNPEKENCVTCVNLDGVIQTGKDWAEVARTQGIYPMSPALACTGRYCGCVLTKV